MWDETVVGYLGRDRLATERHSGKTKLDLDPG